MEESSSTHPTHYTKSTTVFPPTPPPQPTLTTYQKQKKAEPTLPESLTNDMEEDKPNSDIEFEDEEVEEEGDVHLLEYNEDEVLEGDKEYFSNSDPEALEIVEPAKKVPENLSKSKEKINQIGCTLYGTYTKLTMSARVLTLALLSQRKGRRASQSCPEKGGQASTLMVISTIVGMKEKIN